MDSRISQVLTPWRRYLPALLAIGGGVALSLAAFFVVRWWESRGVQAAFRLAAEDRSSAVRGTFETEVAMLELVRSALAGAGRLQPDEYRELLAPFLSRTHSIQAVRSGQTDRNASSLSSTNHPAPTGTLAEWSGARRTGQQQRRRRDEEESILSSSNSFLIVG